MEKVSCFITIWSPLPSFLKGAVTTQEPEQGTDDRTE